jgi:hypothetical protein
MEYQRAANHRSHELIVRIDAVDGLFEARIEEPGTGYSHFTMSGPPRPYGEVVEEMLEALRRHLLSPGE